MATDNSKKAIIFELRNRAYGSVNDDASFYSVPSDRAEAAPGELLKVEPETNLSLYTVPPGLSMSRIIYQSTASSGRKVPVSAYILWPYSCIPNRNGHPVVAWSHSTSGSNAQCAPSNIRNLWHHYQAPFTIAQAGFVVVATDYAGLGVEYDARGEFIIHEYLCGPAQARDVLYSIPAARKAFPALSREYVLVGSSQGGSSVWTAAQILAERADEGYLGTVMMSPVTRFLDLSLDAPIRPAMVLMLIRSLEVTYPSFRRSDILTSRGEKSLEIYLENQGCNSLLFNIPTDHSILQKDWQQNKHLLDWQERAFDVRRPLRGPVLVLQGEEDTFVDAEVVTKAVTLAATLSPTASIEYQLFPGVTHGPVMHVGSRIYLDWIEDRFSGKAAVVGLRTSIAKPVRPSRSYQAETNFVLGRQTEPWQLT